MSRSANVRTNIPGYWYPNKYPLCIERASEPHGGRYKFFKLLVFRSE